MNHYLGALLAAMLVITAGGDACAEGVYKWVDSEGRTHFGSAPPPGRKAERLQTPTTVTQPPEATPGRSWQEQLQLSNERRELARQKEQETAKREREDNQRCLAARRALDALNSERPLYRVNSQGEREFMEDAQRRANIDAANQRVAAYCR